MSMPHLDGSPEGGDLTRKRNPCFKRSRAASSIEAAGAC